MASGPVRFGFTEKVNLSGQIVDPLGLNPLTRIESALLEGITSQTRRFEYFAFRTWMWWARQNGHTTRHPRVLERLMTVASAAHHPQGGNPPGIPEFGPREEEWRDWPPTDPDAVLQRYGEGQPHSEEYYSGPLRDLRLVWSDDKGQTQISEAGLELAKAYHQGRTKPAFLTGETLPSEAEVQAATDHCFCGHGLTPTEQDLWIRVLLGFRRGAGTEASIAKDRADAFRDGMTEVKREQKKAIRDLLELDVSDQTEDLFGNWEEKGPAPSDLLRRYTLLAFLTIARDGGIPDYPLDDRRQTVRDGFFYGRTEGPDGWTSIRLDALEPTRQAWAVLTHNLYYLTALEAILHDLVEESLHYTQGAALSTLTPGPSEDTIAKIGQTAGVSVGPGTTVGDLREAIGDARSSSNLTVERDLLGLLSSSSTRALRWSAAVTMIASLAQYRTVFTELQEEILGWTNPARVGRYGPQGLYEELEGLALPSALRQLGELVFRRHRHTAAYKHRTNNTRAWVLVEHDGKVRRHDPERGITYDPYREARVVDAVEILDDLGLLTLEDDYYRPTEEAMSWLQPLA